jgi:hypothetical protein
MRNSNILVHFSKSTIELSLHQGGAPLSFKKPLQLFTRISELVPVKSSSKDLEDFPFVLSKLFRNSLMAGSSRTL